MFVTKLRHELPQFPFMLEEGTRAWRVVNLELPIPYIFVSYECNEEDIWLSQTSILWNDADVVDFCRDVHRDPLLRIRQIALLMPPTTSQIDAWHMLNIKEIWTGLDRGQLQQKVIYVGSDGGWIDTLHDAHGMTGIVLESIEYSLTPAQISMER